jgi:adenylate cyclase
MTSSSERKLTTILSADAAGFSRLMGEDESGTFATLKAHRDLIAERIATHRGRVVNTAGDSVLAEFASVVKAVECAVEIQRALGERNVTRAKDRQMWFRIGINLGDVMVDDTDLFGDGVNVAARLQALAEPGGILISGTVFDHVKDKLAVSFDALGPQAVKNIQAAVPAYRVVLAPKSQGAADFVRDKPAVQEDAASERREARRHKFYVSTAVTATFIFFFFAINLFSGPDDIWFQWPSLAILLVYALRMIVLFSRKIA